MAEVSDENVPMAGTAENRIGLDRPAYIYPMFEQALRIADGESIEDHRKRIGELWARFNAVAVRQSACLDPQTRDRRGDLPGPARTNRMISWPYTKLMNSNNMVDQGAALILTSVEQATRLRIPAERWVLPARGHRRARHLRRSPSVTSCTGRRPSGSPVPGRWTLAGLGIDDVDYVDLYSCFPVRRSGRGGRTRPAGRRCRRAR